MAPESLLKHVKFLASDELGGRGNGSSQLERAAQYIAEGFKAAGLKPGGPKGSWFQPFEIVTGLAVGNENRLSIRAASRVISFDLGMTYYPLSATASSSLNAPSAEIKQAQLVFAGYGISAPNLSYDDYAGIDVKNKAVLIFTHEPQETDPKSRFDGAQFTSHATLMEKALAARTRGAVALIAVSDPIHDRDTGAFAGFKRDPQAENYGIPVLRVERSRMLPLLEQWGLDQVAREIDRDLMPRSRPLDGATLDYVERLARSRRTVRNVIAVLSGSDPARASEAVVIGAHYDHLGLGGRHSMNPELAGQIHNGADDNASGTAALIEMARAAAQDRSRFGRTIVFVAFAGEELGLLGSAHYVNNPTVAPIERTVAMINLDMVGRAKGKVMVSGLDGAPSIGADLDAALIEVPGIQAQRFQEGAGVGASDDTSFAVKRIPAIGFFSGFHADYHRPSDDWQLIDSEGAARIASLALELAARLSRRPDRPQFVAMPPPSRSASASGDAGAAGGYGPYFGSIPDFGEADQGVKFADVRENSPAGNAGLRGGDVMTSFGGQPIKTLVDFTVALRKFKPGDEVEVVVQRDGKPLTVKVLLTARQ